MVLVSRICCLCGRRFKIRHNVGSHMPEHCPRCPGVRSNAISHLLPHWMVCISHNDLFRNFLLHVDCNVRFATREEIAAREPIVPLMSPYEQGAL